MLAVIRQSIDGLLSAIHRFINGTPGHIRSWPGQLGEFWRQGANRWFLIVVTLLVMFLLVQLRRQRRQARQEALLRRVSEGLGTAASPQEISGLLFETIFGLVPATVACLYLAKSATGPLAMYAQQYNPQHMRPDQRDGREAITVNYVVTSALELGSGELVQWTPDTWLEPLPTHLTSVTHEHYTVLSLPVTLKDRPPALVRLLLQRSQAASASSACEGFLPLLLAPILARLLVSEQIQHVEAREREATLMTGSSQSLLSAVLAPEALAQVLLNLMARTTDSDAGVVLLAPPAAPTSQPQILASYAFEPDVLRQLLVTHDAAGLQLPSQVSSLKEGGAVSPVVSSLLHQGFGAFIEVPICLETEPVGSVIVLKRQGTFRANHQQVCQLYAQRLAFTLQNRAYHEAIFRDYKEALTLIVAAYEASATHLEGHSRRIASLAVELAMRLGLSAAEVEGIHLAGEFHDIGMVVLGEEIVGKPGRLTTQEYDLVKPHPLTGAVLTAPIRLPVPIAPAILHHHERFDGMGYPNGLKGTEIPIAARILGLAEFLDAMLTPRSYREALPLSHAMTRLHQAAGTQVDPEVEQACQQLVREGKLAACGWDWL